jgi:hypothetical protein
MELAIIQKWCKSIHGVSDNQTQIPTGEFISIIKLTSEEFFNNDYGVYTDFLINNLMRVSIIKPYVFGDYKLAIPTRCIKLLQRKWRSYLKKVTG